MEWIHGSKSSYHRVQKKTQSFDKTEAPQKSHALCPKYEDAAVALKEAHHAEPAGFWSWKHVVTKFSLILGLSGLTQLFLLLQFQRFHLLISIQQSKEINFFKIKTRCVCLFYLFICRINYKAIFNSK